MENTKKIVNVTCRSYDKRGDRYVVDLEDGRKGYIATNDMSIYPFKNEKKVYGFVGRSLRAIVLTDDGENPLTLTRIPIMEAKLAEILDGGAIKKVIEVTVISASDMALYVDLGDCISGIIYKTDIISAGFSHPSDVYPVGSKILAKIKGYQDEQKFFTLSHKDVFSKDKDQYYIGMRLEGTVRAPIYSNGKITGYFVQITPAIAGIVDVNDIRLDNGDIIPMIVKTVKARGLKLRLQFPN